MTRFGTTEPDTDPALQRRIVESRARKRHSWLDRGRREILVESAAAGLLLAAAGALAVGFDSSREVEPLLAVALLAAYVVAARVEFYMGAMFTCPTQIVFVPMLFLLPAALVPVVVATGLVLSRVPEYLRGTARAEGAVIAVGDAWHSVGPALVFAAAGVTAPTFGDWPIYLAALVAQFATDLATATIRVRLSQGISPRTLIRELVPIYVVDGLLAPIGLLAAFACVEWSGAFLLALPLIALLKIFAVEREARIENALTLSSAYQGTAHLLGELLSTSHEYTGHHSRSVVVLAHQVGEALQLDDATLREVEFGALLHDVGKMAVPNEIINKPGKLTDEEWELMKTHTVEGYEMLERIGGVLAEVGAVVRSHHERYDGRGYPDGLAGEEIPLASRVITACDSFNAMTTERPYSRAKTIDEAIAEMRAESGRQFDPVIVEALIEVVESWRGSPAVAALRSSGAEERTLAPV